MKSPAGYSLNITIKISNKKVILLQVQAYLACRQLKSKEPF
jgi:hypothetical protein